MMEVAKMCRICIVQYDKQNLIHLTEPFKGQSVLDAINLISRTKILQSDNFPDKICEDCLIELDAAINFQQKCKSSNHYLCTLISENENKKQVFEIKEESSNDIDNPRSEIIEYEPEYELHLEIKHESQVKGYVTHIKSEINEFSETSKTDIKQNKYFDCNINHQQVQCNECKEIFKSKCKLGVHWKKTHLKEALTCPRCMREFKSYKAFNKHQAAKDKSCIDPKTVNCYKEGKKTVFACKKCYYTTNRLRAFKIHYNAHVGIRPYQCHLCSKAFTQLGSLIMHKESVHKILKHNSMKQCDQCGRLIHRSKASVHKRYHTQKKSFQCDICKVFVSSRWGMVQHLKRHSAKTYTCDRCAASFFTIADLCSHNLRLHSDGYVTNKKFKCQHCNYHCTKHKLSIHEAKHSPHNFPCERCGRFFDKESRLKTHSRIHTAERNFHCSFCALKFLENKTLQNHIRNKHRHCIMTDSTKKLAAKTDKAIWISEDVKGV